MFGASSEPASVMEFGFKSSALIWRSRSWAMDRGYGPAKDSRPRNLQRRKPASKPTAAVSWYTFNWWRVADRRRWRLAISDGRVHSSRSSTVWPCLVSTGEPSLAVCTELVDGCPAGVIITMKQTRQAAVKFTGATYNSGWRGGVTVRHLGLRSVGRVFKSCSRQRCVTTLGKLFTPMCLCHQAV